MQTQTQAYDVVQLLEKFLRFPKGKRLDNLEVVVDSLDSLPISDLVESKLLTLEDILELRIAAARLQGYLQKYNTLYTLSCRVILHILYDVKGLSYRQTVAKFQKFF